MNQKKGNLPIFVTGQAYWHQSLPECPGAQADVKSDFKISPTR